VWHHSLQKLEVVFSEIVHIDFIFEKLNSLLEADFFHFWGFAQIDPIFGSMQKATIEVH